MKRKYLIAAAAGAVAATALAGGIAYATIPGDGGVIQGCYDSGGNLKVVPALPCPKGYTQLPWNQQGPPGKDGLNGTNGKDGKDGANGVSVTSTALGQSDANCPEGGSQFTAVNGVTYACNGAPGPKGDRGDKGDKGESGPAGVSGYEIVSQSTIVDTQHFAQLAPKCPAGERVLGGGAVADVAAPTSALQASFPSLLDPSGDVWEWVVSYFNGLPFATKVTAYAICANAA
jgi:hypothetical protein